MGYAHSAASDRLSALGDLAVTRIGAGEALSRLRRGEPIVFVDARREDAWRHATEKLPGALRSGSRPVDETLPIIPEGTTVVYCMCRAEASSFAAAELLVARGYEDVHVLYGGLPAWRLAEGPMERGVASPRIESGDERERGHAPALAHHPSPAAPPSPRPADPEPRLLRGPGLLRHRRVLSVVPASPLGLRRPPAVGRGRDRDSRDPARVLPRRPGLPRPQPRGLGRAARGRAHPGRGPSGSSSAPPACSFPWRRPSTGSGARPSTGPIGGTRPWAFFSPRAGVVLAFLFVLVTAFLRTTISDLQLAPFLERASSYTALRLTALSLSVAAIFLLYRFLPNHRVSSRDVLPAAIGAGIVAEAVRWVYLRLSLCSSSRRARGPTTSRSASRSSRTSRPSCCWAGPSWRPDPRKRQKWKTRGRMLLLRWRARGSRSCSTSAAARSRSRTRARSTFPEAGITKLDVVRYYLAVAEGALRGAGGRPNVLVRYANGIHGEFFYQKRAPEKRPDWVEVVALSFPSGRTAEEVVPRDAAALAWMANLGLPGAPPASRPGGGPRAPRRAARRPRSHAGDRVDADRGRRPSRAGGPGRLRSRGLAEDLGLARHPRQRADPSPLVVHAGAGAPPSPSPARSSGGPPTWPPASGGRRSATASSSTTTRTPRTAPWRAPTRCARSPTGGSRRP